MKIVRKEYVRCIYTYEIDLNEDYVAELNDYLKSRCQDEMPDITTQDIIDTIDHGENKDIDVEYKWAIGGNGSFYRYTLRDTIYEIVSEDLWNSDYEEEYHDSEWYETYIKEQNNGT